MLKTKQILVIAIVLGFCGLNLTGCGQMGPLYLPTKTSLNSIASSIVLL
ncbi:MAG: lipoprotein [Sulfuritalea sp.]|nr:lipoprotein [Sulfuritalea sp.]